MNSATASAAMVGIVAGGAAGGTLTCRWVKKHKLKKARNLEKSSASIETSVISDQDITLETPGLRIQDFAQNLDQVLRLI